MEQLTFVATVRLDAESTLRLNHLRKKYFPPQRNFIDAHVTLFHQLGLAGVTGLEQAVIEYAPARFEVALVGPFRLSRGVAIMIESSPLVSMRNQMANRLHPDLSAQDRQPYRPHVTIQNKVTAEEASESLIEIRRDWFPCTATVEGVDLWEYLGGPWQHHALLPFRE